MNILDVMKTGLGNNWLPGPKEARDIFYETHRQTRDMNQWHIVLKNQVKEISRY